MFEQLLNSVYLLPVLAFLLVVLLIPVAIRFAHIGGFLDEPGGEDNRKQHKVAVPPIGGLVMFFVFLPVLYVSGVDFVAHWGVLSALLLVLISGALDDRFHIRAGVKLVVQVTATILIIWPGGAVVDELGNMFGFGDVALGWFSYLFSFAAVLLLINAVNLSDGLDGLAGGQSFVILGWLLFAAMTGGRGDMVVILLLLMAVLAGFLVYNMRSPLRQRAVLFMGDAGSMALGVMIAFLAITLGQEGEGQVFSPMSIAWIIALPIMDACAQFIRRMKQGKHPFEADRGHFHHLFVDSGVPVGRTVFVIILLCALFGLFGASTYFFNISQWILTIAWAGVFGIYTMTSIKPDRFKNMLAHFGS